MKKLAWRVQSTAKIGLKQVIPAMQKSPWYDMRATIPIDEAGAVDGSSLVSETLPDADPYALQGEASRAPCAARRRCPSR